MISKKCSKCSELKELNKECFPLRKDSKDGFGYVCRLCVNKIKLKHYYNNSEEIKKKHRAYTKLNSEKANISSKKSYHKNKNKISTRRKADRVANPDKYKEAEKNCSLERKISRRIRNRLKDAIKNNYKSGSALKYLGCTIEEFKTYLEVKFIDGMCWENWGFGEDKWHLDHIRPLASFDLKSESDLKIAGHYTNLQPLWQKDNLSKWKK